MKRGKREVKRAYGLGRRFLAMFLAMVMCTSMLQLTAFAAEYKNQVMPGSYIVDANGNAVATTDTVVEQDGFTLKKEIKQTGKDAFNITLTVETSQTVTTNEAAIQLVIDTSTSMDYCSNCSSSSSYNSNCSAHNVSDRMTEVKKVLTMDGGFLDSLVEANTGAINVSVVTYGLGAKTVTLDRADADQWIDIKDPAALAKAKSAINDLDTTDNATNMQAGLMLARNRLGMDAVKNAAVKYTVLLTDGYANTYTRNDDKNSTTSISNGSSPSGPDGTDAGKNNATSMAGQVKATNTLLYAVGYGTDKPYLTDIIGDETKVFVGSDSASVAGAFKDIAEAAVSGMTGAGTSVTDPMGTDGGKFTMGQFIVLGNVSGLSNKGVTSSGGTLTWELDPEKAEKKTVGDTTTYTYSITYPITLNTAAEGFEEGKYYPTNGYTYLSVPQADGSTKPIAFLVPGVCGEIPEVNWTVEYYLQKNAAAGDYGNYTKDAVVPQGAVDLWRYVDAPNGYADKYASETGDDYEFVNGLVRMRITPTGDNVMRLYYNLVMEDVVVNHYYKTDYIRVDGTSEPGTYSATPDVTDDPVTCKVNSDYTAALKPNYNNAEYTLDNKMSNQTITVTEDGQNVINLYYSRLVDQKTSAQVNHEYRTYSYVFNEETYKYEIVPTITKVEVAEKAGAYATSRFAVSDKPLDGYEDYELTSEGDYNSLLQDNGTLSFIVAENAADNIRTLVFEKYVNVPDTVTVTVNHHYTKFVTVIDDNGDPQTTSTSNTVTLDPVSVFVGEKFTTSELNVNELDDATYDSDSGNADKLTTAPLTESTTIDLYYTRSQAPQKTTVAADHYWRTLTEVTFETYEDVTEDVTEEVTDPETGEVTTVTTQVTKKVVTGTDTRIDVTIDHHERETYEGLFEGQKHVEAPMAWEGATAVYTFNSEESVNTVYAGSGEAAVMYYDKDASSDNRSDTEIAVQHIYTTHVTTIVDNAVKSFDVVVKSDVTTYSGKVGDLFKADAEPVYDGKTYTQITSDAELEKILQPSNGTIEIEYERTFNDLNAVKYSVNYEYHTYTMSVKNGVADYYDAPSVEYGTAVNGEGFVGQKITLDPKAVAGFDAVQSPAIDPVLKETGNNWTFIYKKYVPLEKGSVTVNHHYSIQTIALNGKSEWDNESDMGTPVKMYLGESYTANPATDGYVQMDAILDSASFAKPYTLTVSGDHVVDFHYKKVVDERQTADYTVTHQYFYYDYDHETLLSSSVNEPVEYTGYVAHRVTADPDPDTDYTLISVTFNGVELPEAPYSAYLVEGEDANAFVFTYEKVKPQDMVNVKVIHNYYMDADSVGSETADFETFIENETVAEDTVYTAKEHVLKNADYTYTFHSSDPERDPESNTTYITVDDEGENVIIMNYIRATAEYKVIHIYNRNGVEEGSFEQEFAGLDGDVVYADKIDRVPEYNGKTYTFKSITDDITLKADEMKTITLVYNRTTGGGGGGGGTIIIPETPVPLDPQPEPEVEIPEEDVPLVEIPEEEVPLVDVPKTGDASALWMLMSVLSGTGLAGVTFLGRKKKEEE